MDLALARAVALNPAERHEALSAFVTDLLKPNESFVHQGKRLFSRRTPFSSSKLRF